MLYNYLKILHIISATGVLVSMAYSFYLWRTLPFTNAELYSRIQTQTVCVIIPFALLQLITGFTMISLQRYNWQLTWIINSVVSFMLAIISWLGFIYFLLLSQQAAISPEVTSLKRYRYLQSLMLLLCSVGLLGMIFFMANKNT